MSAKLNLEWTEVKSPIDGQISRYYLTPGNLVNQDVTQLTTVVSLDPMYVYFDMDEPTLLRIKQAMRGDQRGRTIGADLAMAKQAAIGRPAEVARMGAGQGEDGLSARREPSTSSTTRSTPAPAASRCAANFANPRPAGGTYLLVPGMFVRVRLPIGQAQDELLVIDRAIDVRTRD